MTTPSYITLENSQLKLSELLTQIDAVIAGGVSGLKTTGTLLLANSDGVYKGGLRYNSTSSRLQYTNDGTNWSDITSDSFQWSSSATYAAGAMVYYQNAWYKCVTASTTDVPGSGSGWAILTSGNRIRYVGSNAELTKALTEGCRTIVVTGDITGNVTATVGYSPVSIFSHEGVTFSGSVALTIPANGNVYWHAYGTPMSGSGITATGGTLWINRLVTGSITLTGNVKYQCMTGTVTGGTYVSWDGVDVSGLLGKDLTALTATTWNDTSLLYVYDNGPRKMALSELASEAARKAIGYMNIDGQGTLANRPATATVGYRYYATDTGDLYTYLATNAWSNPMHVQGPAGSMAIPAISNTGVLTWTLGSSSSPVLPGPITIKGANGTNGTNGVNGWTFTPSVSAAGVLSWTVSQVTSTPSTPASVDITGPVGYTMVPSVSQAGIISWTRVQSDNPPTPSSQSIKGPQGETGATGATGATGPAGASPVVTFTQGTGYRTMTVTVGSDVTSTTINDGAQGAAGPAGEDGDSAYVYVRYAEDAQGTGFSSTPSNTRKYIGVLTTDTEVTPTAAMYTGLWAKYIGDNGTLSSTPALALAATASAGTSSEASRADHVHPNTGLVTVPSAAGTTGQVLAKAATGYQWADQPTWATLSGKPALANVATTGAYSDLSGKPTIPTVNDATVTITQGGVTKGSFTLNGASPVTVALDAGGGTAAWGSITGTLSSQTDLNTALGAKLTTPAGGTTGQVLTVTGSNTYGWTTPSGTGDMTKAVYDVNNRGYVDAAAKLHDSVSIGSASFDGSASITLTQMGAASSSDLSAHTGSASIHVPATGTTGYVLTKTASGTEWAPGGSVGSVAFAAITGQPTDNANLATALSAKYAKPASGIPATDLASSVQTSLSKADTALQTETYTGTITGITMNGSSKGTSGVVNLGTVLTEHQDLSGKQNTITATGLLKGSGSGTVTAAVAGTDYQPALPSGTTGYYLRKTSTGVEWAAGGGSGSPVWGAITGTLSNQSDLYNELQDKADAGALLSHTADDAIHVPEYGTAGYYLKKTASGTEWAAVSGGGGASWGSITGTLSNQTDLAAALLLKQDREPVISESSGTSLSILPGCVYRWTMTGNGTLSLGEGWVSGCMSDAIVILTPGSYTLTCAGNLTLVDTIQANKDNLLLVRWLGYKARVYVVDSEEVGTITTQAVTATGSVNTAMTKNLADYVTVSTGSNATYALATGNTLPAGLSLSSAGVVSGTPTAESSATVTVNVTASDCAPATLLLTFSITAGTVVDLGTWSVEYTEMGEVVPAYNGPYSATDQSITTTYGTFPVYSNGTYKIFPVTQVMGEPVTGICWGIHSTVQTDGYNCTAYCNEKYQWACPGAMGGIKVRFNNTGSTGTGPYVSVSTSGYATTAYNTSAYLYDGNYYLHSGTATSPSAVWKLNSPVVECYIVQSSSSYCPWVIRRDPTSYSTAVNTIVDNYYTTASYDSTDGINVALSSQVTYNGCTSLYHAS